MLYEVTGDLIKAKQVVIAHGCNCQGAMGAGVAKVIRDHYPDAYYRYRDVCLEHRPEELLGRVLIVPISPQRTVANCFTQLTYGWNRRYADHRAIESCLVRLGQWLPEVDGLLRPGDEPDRLLTRWIRQHPEEAAACREFQL